jgi:hypothetical protein
MQVTSLWYFAQVERFSSLPIRSLISATRSTSWYGTGVSTVKPVLLGSDLRKPNRSEPPRLAANSVFGERNELGENFDSSSTPGRPRKKTSTVSSKLNS